MDASERGRLQIMLFERSHARLKEVLALDETYIVRDALIQRFEFCFEMAWKVMFRLLLDMKVDVPEQVMPVLQEAFKAKLHSDADGWSETRDCRNRTSHTYDEQIAIEVAAFVRARAVALFDDLAARLKSLA